MYNLGYRWGITWLKGWNGYLTEDEVMELMGGATDMYLSKERERKLETDTYEGLLHTEGKHQLLGQFGGQEFRAEIDTNSGKADLVFLVTERVNENLN